MSSHDAPSSLTIPLKFRRKSSSASTSVSMDSFMYSRDCAASSSSPPLSSSPLPTPLHSTRRCDSVEWQTDDDMYDLDRPLYDPQDKAEQIAYSWSCRARPEHSFSDIHPPLPSLMAKFATHTLRRDVPVSYRLSPFSTFPQTSYLYPQGDSAIADDGEEYDLESMDIQIRETYFATSAERGRWLSSPIAPRVRPQVVPRTRGHSSPVKAEGDAFPLKEPFSRPKQSCSINKQILPSSKDHDEDVRSLSPLPPSSPLASPMSNLSLLSDDCVDDHHPNSDDCHSSTGTPELSVSSTTCTSPVERTHRPTPHKALAIVHPTDSPSGSITSRQTSPCASHSPRRTDVDVHSSDTTDFGPDDVLSPLSQLELELPETEPAKLPLSDTVNRSYPGQPTADTSTAINAAWSQDGPSCIRTLSMDSNELLDVLLDTVCGSRSSGRAKNGKQPVTGNRPRRAKKSVVVRSGSPPPDTKKKRGTRDDASGSLKPPSKKCKLLRDSSGSCGMKSLSRRGRAQGISRPPSRLAAEDYGAKSTCARNKKTPNTVQQPPGSPTIQDAIGAIDAEFHVLLTGVLIEALATSRATSMDAAALYLVLTQAHPHLATNRSKQTLLVDIATVLEAGRTRCGMFEKVDSSGEGTRHKALESRWFYVPERDEDRERASLISAIMPRQKRSETKKYKQYYYRPLDKMSRWDPEDAP